MKHPWDRPLGLWYLAEHHPDHPAVLSSPSGGPVTTGELAARAHRIVHALRALGAGHGDVIGLVLPNDVDIVVWQLAVTEAGWRYVTLNTRSTAAEVTEIAAHAEMKALVVHASFAEGAGAATGVPIRVSVGGDIESFTPQEDLVHGRPGTVPPDRTAGASLVYTSGTTGRPKGIWRDLPDVAPEVMADGMKTFAHAFRFTPLEGAHLVSAGMFHGGCQAFYLAALHVGQPLVIMGSFDAEETLRLVQEHRVTTAYMVPTQFTRLLRLPQEVKDAYDVSSLESVVHSAAPCPVEVKRRMMDWWGPVIWETYGGTEGAATIAKPHHWLAKPGTVGRPIRGMTVRILDEDGTELPPGQVGTVYLDGGAPSFTYHRDPEQTAEVHRGSAFTLGDVGYLDEDGFLFIVDRIKDMIITGGVNVYPAEVEAVLAVHPAVLDCAVVGVPDPEWGEQVRAFVQPAPGHGPSDELAAELIAYCRERLTGHKCPRAVEFRGELPRTDTGKLYKRLLRDEFREREAAARGAGTGSGPA